MNHSFESDLFYDLVKTRFETNVSRAALKHYYEHGANGLYTVYDAQFSLIPVLVTEMRLRLRVAL